MSLKEVLADHKAARDARLVSIENRGKTQVSDLKERNKADLAAFSNFSKSLRKKLVTDELDRIEKAKQQGILDAREKEIDDLDQTGDDGIPQEEKDEDKKVKDHMISSKKAFDTAALNVQTRGGRFEDAYNVKSLSGWRVFAEREETARLAGEEYSGWLQGEMARNQELELVDNDGKEFTPASAETLEQKRIAMKALRQKFMKEQGLLGIKRTILSDKFYPNAIKAHRSLADTYEKEDAIAKSLEDYEAVQRQYDGDRDFSKLLSSLAPLAPEGKPLKRAGALDEGFEIIKGLASIDKFDAEDYEELGNQPSGFKNKKGEDILVKDKWGNRYLQLGKDLAEVWKENAKLEQDKKETAAKEEESKVFEEMSKMKPEELTKTWVDNKINELGSDPKYGGYSFTKLKNYAKSFAVDIVHYNNQENEIKEKIANNSLTTTELSKYDPRLIDQYKAEAAIIDKQKGITGKNLKALEEFVKEDAKIAFGNKNHPTIRNIIPKIKSEYIAVLAEARANPDALPKGTDAASYAFQVITTKYQDLSKFRGVNGYTKNLGLLGNDQLLKTAESIHLAETKKNEILKDKTLGEVLDPKVASQLISKESLNENIKGMQHNPGYTYPPIVTDIVQRYQKQYRQETGQELDEIDVMNALNQAINPDAEPLPKPNSIKTFTKYTNPVDRKTVNSKQSSKEQDSRILGGVAFQKGSENIEFIPPAILEGFEKFKVDYEADGEIDLSSFTANYELLGNNPLLASYFDITPDELTPDGEGINWEKFNIASSMLGNWIDNRIIDPLMDFGEYLAPSPESSANPSVRSGELKPMSQTPSNNPNLTASFTPEGVKVLDRDLDTEINPEGDFGYEAGQVILETISDIADWTTDQINVWLDSIVDDDMVRERQLAKYKTSGNINDAPLRQ